jgi:hypothetical protein
MEACVVDLSLHWRRTPSASKIQSSAPTAAVRLSVLSATAATMHSPAKTGEEEEEEEGGGCAIIPPQDGGKGRRNG